MPLRPCGAVPDPGLGHGPVPAEEDGVAAQACRHRAEAGRRRGRRVQLGPPAGWRPQPRVTLRPVAAVGGEGRARSGWECRHGATATRTAKDKSPYPANVAVWTTLLTTTAGVSHAG